MFMFMFNKFFISFHSVITAFPYCMYVLSVVSSMNGDNSLHFCAKSCYVGYKTSTIS